MQRMYLLVRIVDFATLRSEALCILTVGLTLPGVHIDGEFSERFDAYLSNRFSAIETRPHEDLLQWL